MRRIRPFWLAALAVVVVAGGARAESRFSLYANGNDVQTPGHPLVFTYGTDAPGTDPVTVTVYRVPERVYLNAMRAGENLSESAVKNFAVVSRGTSAPEKDAWNRKIVVPALPIGVYAAVAKVRDAVAVSPLDVTTMGLVRAFAYNAAGGDAIGFPVDLRTFRRYAGVRSAELYDSAGVRALPVADGLMRVPSGDDDSTLVVRGDDGSLAVARAAGVQRSAGEVGFIQTDRPVYRPGDTIDVRAILRDGSMSAYRVATGTRRVRLQAPDGSDVFNHALPVSAFGTID